VRNVNGDIVFNEFDHSWQAPTHVYIHGYARISVIGPFEVIRLFFDTLYKLGAQYEIP